MGILVNRMGCIITTFAHGNGPFSRCVEWAIEVNNVREARGKPRLPVVVPLVYPGRQERILREEIGNNISPSFLNRYPYEILFDKVYGELLSRLMFKGNNYEENLEALVNKHYGISNKIAMHLDGKRNLESFSNETVEMDLRDAEFQLGLNNRVRTDVPFQFYVSGGAGPFDELLKRAMDYEIARIGRNVMKTGILIAEGIMEDQEIIFSNEPGVFSFDSSRARRHGEIFTPPFVHFPKRDKTKLPGKGIYLTMTGIDGIRESGIYNAAAELGMHIYTPGFSIKSLPKAIRKKAISLNPSQLNNPNVVCHYARAGWSSIWLSHLAEKGFITPAYQDGDDPEIFFNHQVIRKFGLGVIIDKNPKSALERAIELAQKVWKHNGKILSRYGTLDGIRYSAEVVADYLEGRDVSRYRRVKPVFQ